MSGDTGGKGWTDAEGWGVMNVCSRGSNCSGDEMGRTGGGVGRV